MLPHSESRLAHREPAPEDNSAHLQVPAVDFRPPALTDTVVRDDPGAAWMRRGTGIAATARSASMPRLAGLPQFHPEDVAAGDP